MIVRVASSRVRVLRRRCVGADGRRARRLQDHRHRSTDPPARSRSSAAQRSEADWRREADASGENFRANPRDADNAIRYAQALRATGQRAQAAAVLETAAIHNPEQPALLGAYGRALADAGNFKQALDVLERAHTPDQPDWRILSVQGAVLDQMGRHDEAQRYYASALQDRAGRAVGAVQSRPVLRAVEGPEARRRRRCAAPPRTAAATSACARTSRWWSACRAASQEAETIARADLPPERSRRERRLSAPDAGAEGRHRAPP